MCLHHIIFFRSCSVELSIWFNKLCFMRSTCTATEGLLGITACDFFGLWCHWDESYFSTALVTTTFALLLWLIGPLTDMWRSSFKRSFFMVLLILVFTHFPVLASRSGKAFVTGIIILFLSETWMKTISCITESFAANLKVITQQLNFIISIYSKFLRVNICWKLFNI